jgi:hypothetical protein
MEDSLIKLLDRPAYCPTCTSTERSDWANYPGSFCSDSWHLPISRVVCSMPSCGFVVHNGRIFCERHCDKYNRLRDFLRWLLQ